MAFPMTNKKTYNFYRRYIWSEEDFAAFEDLAVNFPATLLANLCEDSVLAGLKQNSFSGLNANYKAGLAMNSLGDLLAIAADGSVAVTNNVKSLIVVRPVHTSTNPITRPTAPFDVVNLNEEQTALIVAIAGSSGAYPAKAAGDVVLFGVTASGGNITQIDESQCELIGKKSELASLRAYKYLVGTSRDCDFRTLAEALAVAVSGDKIRVRNGETIDTTIVCSVADVEIECDPGVAYAKGSAATGFTFSGNGVRFKGGRISGFGTAGNKAINITSDFCTIAFTRFSGNDTDVNDVNGTSTTVGVINE